MADVAKAAGCSQATVSLVLNDVTEVQISAELKARVILAARELGYGVSGPVRRSGLDNLRGSSVGFIVDQLATTPEAINAIEGARIVSWDQDVTILVAQSLDRERHEELAIERLLAAGVGGIVFMSVFTRPVELSPAMRRLPVPAVLLNCYTSGGEYPSIIPDELAGGRRATATLLDRGHQRIATITGEMFMEAAGLRLAGYRQALSERRLDEVPEYVVRGNWTPSSGYDATRQLMSLKTPPTAIFCQNDQMALGCLNALLDMGLKVPDDISLVGYDDSEICRQIRPQLTSVDLPHRTMGGWAIASLSSARGAKQQVRKADCALVNRASVMRIGGDDYRTAG
jgi:LacI family transcriptional regulator